MTPQIILFVSSSTDLHGRYDSGVRTRGFRLLPVADAGRAEVLLTQFRVAALVFHLRANDEQAWQALERMAHAAGSTPMVVLAAPDLLDRLRSLRALDHEWAAMLPDVCSAGQLAMTLRDVITGPEGLATGT